MTKSDKQGLLGLLFAVSLFLLSYPVLGLADQESLTMHTPTLGLYILTVWLLLIAATYALMRSKPSKRP